MTIFINNTNDEYIISENWVISSYDPLLLIFFIKKCVLNTETPLGTAQLRMAISTLFKINKPKTLATITVYDIMKCNEIGFIKKWKS